MELAALLKQTRHAIGMTQVQIAQALHLSFSTINRWENGHARPNPLAAVTVLALAREKNTPPELLGRLEAALWDKNEGGKFLMNSVDKSLLGETISDNLIVRTTEPGFPVQYIGEGIARLLGYASAAELAGALDEESCIHPDDLRFMTEGIRQQLEDGEKYALEYRVRRKDGSYIWVQDHGKRVRAAEGKAYLLSTYYDLSGQNEARADESRLYGDIVRQSTDGVYVLEQGTYRLLYANDAMENIFKSVGIHNYQGEKCHCVLRNRTQPCADCFVYPATKAGEPREIYVDFLSRYYAVRSHSVEWRGRPATVIYLSDISEGKRSRYELAKTQQKLAAAIDHAGLAYWEYDILNSRAYLNTISTTEYTLDEIIENYPAALYETGTIHPDSIALYNSLIEEIKSGQPTARADIKTIDAKGNLVWKRVRLTTLFDEKGKPFWAVATAESIDDYKSLESRFTTVLEQNHIDTWMYDIPRHTIIQNHNTEEVYGVHGAEIPDVPESLIAGKQCHPEDVECFRDFYRRLHQGETQVSATVRLWDIRTETYIWKRCTYSILPSRNGESLYALGSAVEINDQMETKQKYEDALRYRYRTLGENVILAGHCNVTRNVILEVEDKTGLDVEHRFGMVREDFFDGIGSLIPDLQQQQIFRKTFGNENMKNSFELGITQHDYDCPISLDSGKSIRWISTHVDTALQPETGELIGFLTVTDISAGKMQEQVLDAVIQFDYDFVAHLNLHSGTAVFYNSKNQMAQLQDYTYGIPYSYADAVKHTADAYIAEEDKSLYVENMSVETVVRQLAERDSYEFTYHLREESGELRTKQTRFAMHDRTAGIVVFSRTDVTDMLTQQEKQKIALSESLALAQQANSSKSKFLSSMSHDIRTPMNAIVGMCKLAIGEEDNPRQVHESLQVIEQSSALLLSMITDILDMNRIESGKMVLTNEAFSFSEQLQLAVGRARALAAKKQQTVELTIDITHDHCTGDIVRIHRVIDNILANALKFTPEGGAITYHLSEIAIEHKQISFYRFAISDTGIGISPEQQAHIFEPFYRVQNSMTSRIEGAGLGLSIVKSIVDYMGGTISLHSTPGVGTTFIIELPLRYTEEDTPRQEPEKVSSPAFDLTGVRVLLCEDHPMNQLVATRILEKAGVLVTVAGNGRLGCEAFLKSATDTFDAILMDVQMPVMNGYEATRAIRSSGHPRAATIPILAMTANAFAEDVQKSIDAGMNGHLAKPIEPEQLYETLATFVAPN